MTLFVMPAIVSVAVQKAGPEFFHPIGRTEGKAMSGLSCCSGGKASVSLGISLITKFNR